MSVSHDLSTWNRSAGRDVLIYDAQDPTIILGGLICTSNRTLYATIEISIFFNSKYYRQHENGMNVPRNEQSIQPGKYYIMTTGSITHQ
ncbi:hypothetical protein EV426DRAFT_582573 [Tirmania nivea]|nr:hypothetical protein EV426DRAFT_582573 [Tirmania nivea]